MPSDPASDEVRAALCRVLGWHILPDWHGHTGAVPPGGGCECSLAQAFDPAADLNDMAAVEAVLAANGLADEYVAALWDGVGAERDSRFWTERVFRGVFACVTATAAVRAMAAYRVLATHEAPPGPRRQS